MRSRAERSALPPTIDWDDLDLDEPDDPDEYDELLDLSGPHPSAGFTARILRDGVEVEIYVPLTVEPTTVPLEPNEELSESPLDEDPTRVDPRGGSRGAPN